MFEMIIRSFSTFQLFVTILFYSRLIIKKPNSFENHTHFRSLI